MHVCIRFCVCVVVGGGVARGIGEGGESLPARTCLRIQQLVHLISTGLCVFRSFAYVCARRE